MIRFFLFIALVASALANATCGKNEEYRECGGGTAVKTCFERTPSTDKMCYKGCYCKEEYVRSKEKDGECVLIDDCAKHCGENAEFVADADTSWKLCVFPNRGMCRGKVKNVCRCKEGFYFDGDGKCKTLANCVEKPEEPVKAPDYE